MAINLRILAKRVVNKVDSSSSFTKRVKGENYFVILNIDNVVVKMQSTCFKGKVMIMYQSVDNLKTYTSIFKKILVDHEGFQKLALVILEALAPHHSNKIGNYIKFISFSCDAKFKYENGDNPCVIKINLSNIRVCEKISFPPYLVSIGVFVTCKV